MNHNTEYLTTIPTCDICNEKVGDNEWDGESGGYFSRHYRCYSPCQDGRYRVAVLRPGATEEALSYGRYTHHNAAIYKRDHLAFSNYDRPGVEYIVRDMETHEVWTIPGQLVMRIR